MEHGGGWVINIVSAEAIAPYPSAPVRLRVFRARTVQDMLYGVCLKQRFSDATPRCWELPCAELMMLMLRLMHARGVSMHFDILEVGLAVVKCWTLV